MQLAIDGWQVDAAARTARRGDQEVQLSPRAIRLLQVLVEANGSVLSRGDLLDRVWPNVTVSDESLTQVVAELRRKLGNRDLIATVARGGYRLTAPTLQYANEGHQPAGPSQAAFSLDAYALCIEAREVFERGGEGAPRAFVSLAAQAAALAPDFAEARALHATALLKRHIYMSEGAMLLDVALAETEAAIALDPSLASAHLIDAAARIAIGCPEPGLRSLATALSLGRDDPEIHLEAAILFWTFGNRRTAAALATKSAQLAPDNLRTDVLLARLLMCAEPHKAQKHAERALRKLRDTLSADPQAAFALYALGPLLAQLGDRRAARSALESVAHHDSPLEYFRAVGFAQIGDTTAALERLDFLTQRGWRHVCILDKDDGFRALHTDPRLMRLQFEARAA